MWNTKRDHLILGTFWAFIVILFIFTKLNVGPVMLPMLKANESNPTAYYNRGNRYLYGNPGYAITYYSHALDLDPDYVEALYQRALAYSRVENPDAALADLNRAVELAPDEATYLVARANLHKKAYHFDLALRDYDQAISLDPRYDAAYFNRANAYYDAGQKDAALRDYRAFLDIHPLHDQVYLFASQRVEELTGTG
jgi:tetratricopeptide (TPR) repeat protein